MARGSCSRESCHTGTVNLSKYFYRVKDKSELKLTETSWRHFMWNKFEWDFHINLKLYLFKKLSDMYPH